MRFTLKQKEELKRKLIYCLSSEKEIVRIVIFGSFVNSDDPHDMDVAVFQDSNEAYLPLAMKYRKKTNEVSDIIPLDIIPLKSQVKTDPFLSVISNGEVIYER
jgi:predicted nucleotidyltransferase